MFKVYVVEKNSVAYRGLAPLRVCPESSFCVLFRRWSYELDCHIKCTSAQHCWHGYANQSSRDIAFGEFEELNSLKRVSQSDNAAQRGQYSE